MSGRGSSNTRGAAASRGCGREARALQGWLMKPTARRRSLSSASSLSPTGVPSVQATASSPRGRGAQTTRSGSRGRGLGRGRGTRARGRGRGRGGRGGRGSFATRGATTPAVRSRGSRGRGRPRGRAGRASSREPVGARSQQESEAVVKTEAGGSGQGAGIRETPGGEAAVPEDASSEKNSSSSSLEDSGTPEGSTAPKGSTAPEGSTGIRRIVASSSSSEGSTAGRRVVGRISEGLKGREGAAAAAAASDEDSSSGDDGMDVDDDDDDDDEEEDDDDSGEDNDDEGDKESEEEEEEEEEKSDITIEWASAQDDDSDEGEEADEARGKAAGARDEAVEEGLDQEVLSAIVSKIRQGREGDNLYKGLGKGWRKYCTAAKAAVRKKAEEPPRRPRRGRPPGSIGKKRKLLLEQQQEQYQRLQQQQQQQPQPSLPSPRSGVGRKLLKLAAKPPSGGGGSGSPATVSSAARAARAARTWTKESKGGAGKQKRVPKAASPRSRKKPAEGESHEEDDGAEDYVREKGQGDGEGGGREAETAAKPPGKKLSAASKERVAYRPRRAGGPALKSTAGQGKFPPSSTSRVTLAPVIPASSAAPTPAAYASWTKKAGENISRHPIIPGRTVPEDGRPATTAAVVPATLPTSSRDGGVGNGGSSSGGGGGISSSIASSVGSSVSVVPDGRGKPTLRPSLVLARNPNRSGYQWPARVCDKDEVEESFFHSDLDPVTHEHKVLVVFLCEGGHHYFAWVPEGNVSLMPAGDIGLGKFGELWPVDFTAAVMWARQLSRVQIDEEQKKLLEAEGDLRRQEAPPYKKPRQASPRSTPTASAPPSQAVASTAGLPLPKGFSRDVKGKVGGDVAKEKGGGKRGGKLARKPGRQPSPTTNVRPGWKPVVEGERGSVRLRQGSVRCHPINAAAHSFFTDELECPWRCKDCGRFTRSCGCGKGLVEYVRRQGERSSHRFEKFACRNPTCICCKPPGLPLFMAEWALSPARFKLRDGERPPAEAKPRRVSAPPPRWEREAIPQGRASARGGSSDPDDTSPTDDATTAEGNAISGGGRSVGSINRANPQYFQRRLGANERCNKCEGCVRPNCGKCWACSHRIEFGGAGNKNQPCIERWCRMKAAQRHADKAERAARRKTLATGGGVSSKRTLDSSGEEYESEDGELSTVDGAGKRFRRSRRAGGGGGSSAAASGGGGNGGRQSPVVGPGGDLDLSFVFIGDGHAGAGRGGKKDPQGCTEAVHVSTESAGVVTKVVNTSTSQTARPSSISKNSRLKDLLTKGYRCLALLEDIGPQPLLKASARVIAAGSMLGSGFAMEGSGDERMGKGIGLTWLGGKLKLESAVRKRLVQFNPFHEVPEIETSTSIEPPPPPPLPEPDSQEAQEAAQHALRRQAQSQSNPDVYVGDSKNKLAAPLPAAATTAITIARALGQPTSSAPALNTPSSAAVGGGAGNGGDVVGTMSPRAPRPDALKEAGSGSSGDASGGASAAVTSATCPPGDSKGSSSDQAASQAAVLGSGLAEASNVSKAEGVSGGMHGGAGKAEVGGGAGNNEAVGSSQGVDSETDGKACTVGQGAGGRGASGDAGAAAKADEAEEKERDAEKADGAVTSKYLGVTKQHGRWVARITRPLSGVESDLGTFDDDVQAAKQYDKYAKMWLENPDVNFPRGTANSRSRGVAPPPAPTPVSTASMTSSASTISSSPRSASCTTSATSERSLMVVDSGVSEVAVNSLAKAAKKAIEGDDADIKNPKERENQASPSGPPPSANEPATSKPRGDGDGDVNSTGGNNENPLPPPQTPLQSQHQLEEQTKQKSEQAESEDDVEIAGSLLVEYLWGEKGEAKRPGEGDSRGNVGGNGTGNGNSEIGTAVCGEGAATMTTTTKTPTQGDSDSGEGSGVREGSGDDVAMMIDSMTSSDESSATVAASDKGEDEDDEASGADEDGGGGTDPEEAGVLLIPAVSRTLRRGYLAQSLARIVGAAGVIRKARCGVERRSGGEGKRENRRGGNDPGLHGAGEALALAKAEGTGKGDSGGGGEASKPKGGTWGAAQEQSAAAMEALDALDKGIEELFDEDERTLRRYARAVEEDACRGLRKRLRQLENQEARAVVQLSKSRMEQEEQKADLAQLESIAGKAFSDKSIKALQAALAAERQAAAEYEARVAEEQRRLDAIKQDRKITKASVAKERAAAAAAGQKGFMKDQEALLKRVKEEWAALRSALRRRLGAARTLLLTDGACRLHAVPSDRLEQPRRMDEAWRALLFLEKVYPNETLLKRCVDPAWVEMVTPETILMLAHSRAYVDQLRTRVDEAGSSVECLTAIDASEDEAVATGTGGGGGRRDAFQNTYGYGYGDRDINSRGNGARDKAERAMAVFGRDTVGNKRSWEAAMTAAGAVLEAVDRVLHGEAHNAFCAVRPPGHHAGVELHCMGAVSNGFCILNNVALAALYARHYGNVGRIAVVDFDVHHGNGTQDVLCRTEHPGFLYVSIHAFNRGGGDGSHPRIFPGTGAADEAHGNVLNIPLGDQVHPYAFHRATSRVIAALDAFRPNLILISAGFDAHQSDPSQLGTLSARDFEVFTRRLVTAAERLCGGRLVSVLEGGYALECQATVRRAGQARPPSPSPVGGAPARVGKKGRIASGETLADCIQAHCKGLVDGLIGGIDDD